MGYLPSPETAWKKKTSSLHFSYIIIGTQRHHSDVTHLAFSGLYKHSSMRVQSRAMVVGSEMPRWLEPKGSLGIMDGITITPAGREADGASCISERSTL